MFGCFKLHIWVFHDNLLTVLISKGNNLNQTAAPAWEPEDPFNELAKRPKEQCSHTISCEIYHYNKTLIYSDCSSRIYGNLAPSWGFWCINVSKPVKIKWFKLKFEKWLFKWPYVYVWLTVYITLVMYTLANWF